MARMKIGILQTGHSPDNMKDALGDYGDMFVKLLGGHDFDFQIWSVVDGDFPASAVDADGWLITGSKHGAYEDHDWIPPLEQLIRGIRKADADQGAASALATRLSPKPLAAKSKNSRGAGLSAGPNTPSTAKRWR